MDWRKNINFVNNNENLFQLNINMIRKMNNAIDYIENHLDGEIDINDISKIACCSSYHFQRFFPFITDIPLSEYIRRRRLTLAAFELQNGGVKVIDIAQKYGYDSPEAFTRAFKSMHGIVPSAVKSPGSKLKAYPPLSFHISIKGDAELNYRIEQKEAFKIFGVDIKVSAIDNQNFVTVPQFWKTCKANGAMDRIRKAAQIDGSIPLHAAKFNCTDISHSYIIGYFAPESAVPKDFTVLPIPASTWAVFPTEELSGEEIMQKAPVIWKRIFTEWFATSSYELDPEVPEFELHFNKGNNKYVTEFWIPVKETGD